MGSSTYTRKAGRVFIALALTTALIQPVSGCAFFKRMGTYMPVSEGAQRCEGRLFCFSGYETDGVPAERLAREERERRRSANPDMMAQQPIPQGQTVQGDAGAVTVPPAPPAMLPQNAPAMSNPMPVYKLPANEEEAMKMQAPAPGAIPPEDAPPGMPAEMLQPQGQQPVSGLKPYEQNNPWKDDNEAVPLIEQMKEQGW